jgi:hypothetical protein
MDRVDLLKFCREALAHYGPGAQSAKACEECNELDAAISLYWKGDGVLGASGVIDEIADVLIMAEQMRLAFGADAVDERIAFKVKRQRGRMAGEEE